MAIPARLLLVGASASTSTVFVIAPRVATVHQVTGQAALEGTVGSSMHCHLLPVALYDGCCPTVALRSRRWAIASARPCATNRSQSSPHNKCSLSVSVLARTLQKGGDVDDGGGMFGLEVLPAGSYELVTNADGGVELCVAKPKTAGKPSRSAAPAPKAPQPAKPAKPEVKPKAKAVPVAPEADTAGKAVVPPPASALRAMLKSKRSAAAAAAAAAATAAPGADAPSAAAKGVSTSAGAVGSSAPAAAVALSAKEKKRLKRKLQRKKAARKAKKAAKKAAAGGAAAATPADGEHSDGDGDEDDDEDGDSGDDDDAGAGSDGGGADGSDGDVGRVSKRQRVKSDADGADSGVEAWSAWSVFNLDPIVMAGIKQVRGAWRPVWGAKLLAIAGAVWMLSTTAVVGPAGLRRGCL